MLSVIVLLCIHTGATAQPPDPVETDTLAPFVTSVAVSAVTSSTVTAGGNVTGDGGATVTERGLVYSSTNTAPTLSNTKLVSGNGTGTFSRSIPGLTGGTLYYVRAYATNIIGTSYGAVVSFTTDPIPPLLTTNEITDISNTGATVGGNVSFSGGATVTERGIVYSSVNTSPTVSDTKVIVGAGAGAFTQAIAGLSLNTLYYVRAYAINSVGTSYGSIFSFTPAGASVGTDAVTTFTVNSANMGGNVTNIGGSAVTDRGVVYVTGNGIPTIADTKVSIGAGAGVFAQNVTGLQQATTYSVRAYATNTAATNYGAVRTFTTLGTLSSMNRVDPTPTNLIVVNYAISFSQAITGLTAANFSLSSTGSITNPFLTAVTGTGTTWNVTAYTGKGDGTLTLNFVNGNGIQPGIGNTFPFAGQTYTIDKSPPGFPLLSIRSNNADTTRAKTGDNILMTFITNEPLKTTPLVTVAGQSVTVNNISGNIYTAGYLTKNTDVEGTVAFTVLATDLIGNTSLTQTVSTNATNVVFDRTVPVVSSINRVSNSFTNADALQYTVTFAEPVTGVDAADFSITTTAALTGASVLSVTGSGAVYTVAVNTGTNNGTIRLDLKTSGTGINDLAGNAITTGFSTGQVYTIAKILAQPVVKTNDPATVCSPFTVDLTAPAVTAGSDPFLTYAYYTNAAATIPLTNPSAVASSGIYYITGTNIANITSVAVAVSVSIVTYQKPTAAFTFDTYCTNRPVNFTNTSTTTNSGSVGYQWTDNNNHTSTVASPAFTYTAVGSYNVKMKVFTQICPTNADSVTQTINIVAPAAAIRMATINTIANDIVQLQARTNVGTTYLWAPSTGLTSTAIPNPFLSTSAERTYTVTITAASGCQTVDTVLARIFGKYVYVPNIFSPNGDGINDILYVNLINVKELRYFRIFNRQGKKVFESTSPFMGWDGRVRGELQPLDTYVWTVEAVNRENIQVNQQGNVTLVR